LDPLGFDLRDWVQRCRAEDERAWEVLDAWVRQCGFRVLAGFRSLTMADKEDVVSKASARLMIAIRSNKIDGTVNVEIAAFIRQTIHRQALNHLRGRVPHDSIDAFDDLLSDDEPTPEQRMVALRLLEAARECLQQLPPQDRYVLLAKGEGLRTSVIRQELASRWNVNLAPSSVDVRAHRLRDDLRHCVDGRMGLAGGV